MIKTNINGQKQKQNLTGKQKHRTDISSGQQQSQKIILPHIFVSIQKRVKYIHYNYKFVSLTFQYINPVYKISNSPIHHPTMVIF